jgi:multidrug efflux pump subunit AcrB
MSGRHRTIVAALFLSGVLALVLLVAFAGNACPVETEQQPCPDATRNLVVGIVLAAAAVGLLVTPFAFLGEFVARRRIVYRGAWARAARRGLLVALVVAILAGLRLAGALSVPTALFVLTLAGVAEWFAIRTDT